jgi:hypothetical protein
LHFTVHAVVPPQTTLHDAVPWHSAVQPPAGHAMLQALVPVHVSVDPVPRVTSHELPPPHVTVLLAPVWSVHVLVPSQVDVQPELHVL